MFAKGGTMCLVGLPPGSFALDIFETVLMRKTIRGSVVGTRLDLVECLQFAGDGKVKVHYSLEPLEAINDIIGRMRANKIDGRVVMQIQLMGAKQSGRRDFQRTDGLSSQVVTQRVLAQEHVAMLALSTGPSAVVRRDLTENGFVLDQVATKADRVPIGDDEAQS